jgi:hypothetical protein
VISAAKNCRRIRASAVVWQRSDWARFPATRVEAEYRNEYRNMCGCSRFFGLLFLLGNIIFLDCTTSALEAPTALPLTHFVGFFILAKAAAGFAAGWRLLQREPWARVLALILVLLDLINVPLGTALGVSTLLVLLPAQSEEDHEKYLGAVVAQPLRSAPPRSSEAGELIYFVPLFLLQSRARPHDFRARDFLQSKIGQTTKCT